MERTNEERLDLLADMMEPAAEIFADPELQKIINSGGAPIKVVKPAIKNHRAAFISILAALEETPVEEYRVPAPGEFFMRVLALFSRPEVKALFTLQSQQSGSGSSGSVTGNTEAGET
jgi:hypothetical protein